MMSWLDDRIPLYSFSWMDSGPNYHFALHGRLCVLTLFLGAVVVAGVSRSRGMAAFFGLLTVATFQGIPLELTAVALLAGYLLWVLRLSLKKQKLLLPALALALTSLAYGQGYLSTEFFSPVQCQVNLRNLATAVHLYGGDYHAPPGRLDQLLQGNLYLSRLPRCRGLDYRIETQAENYTISCVAEHPGPAQKLPEVGTTNPRSTPPAPRPK